MAEKTEAPTPRRRQEARAKGQGVGRSWELSMGLTLAVGTLGLASLLPGIAYRLVSQTQTAIIDVDPSASSATMMSQMGGAIQTTLTLVLPLALLVMIAGVSGNLVSGGLVVSPRAIRFDFSRINPIAGLKRMADRQAFVRLGLSLAKLSILALISWQVVGSRVPAIVGTQGENAGTIAAACLSAVFQLGLTITILLAVVALVDFVVQRRRAAESIRMTKEEVRQEFRESEGDPQIRGARRRRARQIAFSRMMDAVPTADVVVTNPTTLAVAIKYDSLTMRAPRIVAKGQRLMAERIKTLAREHSVPVVEDKPLARALFPRPIGAEIPAHLYRAVARLLVLVHQARFAGAGRNGQQGTSSRSERPRRATGSTARQWWNAAPGSRRAVLDAAGAVVSPVDAAEAARQYSGATDEGSAAAGPADGDLDPATTGVDDPATTDADLGPDDAPDTSAPWFGEELLDPAEVDEVALAAALAEDELGDLTAQELADLEAERAASSRQAAATMRAAGADLAIDIDELTDSDEEPGR
jgi:flagellar biosynthetic protein FlhB